MAHLQKNKYKCSDYQLVAKPLPGNASEVEIKAFFEEYGEIIDFLMPKKVHKFRKVGPLTDSSTPSEKKYISTGICFLSFRRRETAEWLLEQRSVQLGQRTLNLERFYPEKQTQDLNNLKNNQRRVFAKNLPPELASDEAVRCFFKRFGPVDNAHVLPSKLNPAIKSNTAHILFQSEQVAQHLLDHYCMIPVGQSIVRIEGFMHQNKHKIKNQAGNVLPHDSYVLESGYPQKTHQPDRQEISVFSQQHVSKARISVHVFKPQAVYGSTAPALDSTAIKALKVEGFEPKPTCKSYHHDIKEQYEQWHNREYNLRFNTVLHVIASSPPATNIK